MPTIVPLDYNKPEHIQALGTLMNHYASDPFGGGKSLGENIGEKLCRELSARSFAFSLLCYDGDQAVGLVNCFESFSTFSCKPIVNIHDIVVRDTHRGQGISLAMLDKVEAIAREKGCVKLTLEVLSNNHVAKAAYEKFGFSGYQLNPEHGHALFWQKSLS